ncbi:Glucokinase, partial [Phytophthora megakarya]|jgi:hypothetical protein
MVP